MTLHGCAGCTNDRIVIDKTVYRFGDPQPGDVVAFKAPTTSWDRDWRSPRSSNTVLRGLQNAASWFGFAPPDENNLVKRVIATGGQQVECYKADNTGVTVDGQPLSEPYIDVARQRGEGADTSGNQGQSDPCYGPDFGPVLGPKGLLWVMGDNRSYSAGSRYHQEDHYHGTVPVDDVRGKVRFTIYLFSRIGTVSSIDPQR